VEERHFHEMSDLAHNAREMRRWKRRSERVAQARKILPAAIGLIVIVMVGFVVVRTLLPGQLLNAKRGTPMINPRFKGRDKNDQAFLIGAVQALRDETDQNRIVLTQPFVTQGPMRLSSKTGVYRPDQGTLALEGEVVFDDGRNHLTTQHATFDAKLGEADGKPVAPGDGVEMTGQMGRARSDGFHVYNSGERIELTGNVHGLIQPHKK
jgi:lipopolysaccharide export system protein LptC